MPKQTFLRNAYKHMYSAVRQGIDGKVIDLAFSSKGKPGYTHDHYHKLCVARHNAQVSLKAARDQHNIGVIEVPKCKGGF